MADITSIAQRFFDACENGKGWEVCQAYCTPDASFSAQAEPLAEMRTLQGYTEWMKGLLGFMPDGRYTVKSFATDGERNNVCAYRRVLGHPYRRGWSAAADRQKHQHGLRVRHAVRGRQDPPHDQDLEFGLGAAANSAGGNLRSAIRWPRRRGIGMLATTSAGAAMPIIPEIRDYLDELTAIRRDIHAHPEIGFEEERTADIVAAKLAEWGVEVHRGLAKTGVVGTIRRGNSLRAIGLRADMDCLPMQEMNQFPHRSTHDGKMHACGHDGHTTMLLGAARYLAATRNFDGTVHFIFQPGEEGFGGGRVMVEEGLFDKFPCDAVFAMHNKPGIPVGHMATRAGPMLAATDRFDIRIKARGGHAAYPHLGSDPFVIGAQIVMALQTIPARNIDPIDSAVISIGFMRGGSAYNVIPDELHIGGTVRSFRPEVRDLLERRMSEIVRGTAALHGAEAALDYRRGYPPTINHAAEATSRPMSRPRSAARSRSSATSRPRWAARISRTCCWRGRAR